MKPTNKDPDYLILKFVVNVLCVLVAGTAMIYSLTILSKAPMQKEQPVKKENAIKIDSNNYKPKTKNK